MSKLAVHCATVGCALAMLAAAPAFPQTCPAKPIHLLLPFAPEFKERLVRPGSDPVGSTPEQWSEFSKTEIDKWAIFAKLAGVRASD